MPNLCILRAYLMPGVYFKHRWCESCRWPRWKGTKKRSKQRGEGEGGWGRTQTDPACNLQPWQPHKHLLFLQNTHQSSNPVSRAWKIEKSRSRFPSFSPFVLFFQFQSPLSHLPSTFLFFSSRRPSSIEEKKLHHLTVGKHSGETQCSPSHVQCD